MKISRRAVGISALLAPLVLGVWLLLPRAAAAAPNILLIFGDDMGVETLASYGLGEYPPTTATLDRMAQEGVRFTNFWSQPVCSPTRGTVITGRYGFRAGIGRPVNGGPPLPNPPEKPEWASFEALGMGGGGMAGGGEVDVRHRSGGYRSG